MSGNEQMVVDELNQILPVEQSPTSSGPSVPKVSAPIFEKPIGKRALIVDPDNRMELPDPKRPRGQLNLTIKVNVLKGIVECYNGLLNYFAPTPATMASMHVNMTTGTQITSVLFTIHNLLRKGTNPMIGNTVRRTFTYKINHNGVEYAGVNDELIEIVRRGFLAHGLEYKNFTREDKTNWYGTAGPYLDFFSGFGLRLIELRLGHSHMPVGKTGQIQQVVPVSKYGLSGAHHVLLEGISFPPERKSSMIQSLGPMTSFLMMITARGEYRKKFENAVKRSYSHINCIDDVINISRDTRNASDLQPIITLLAEISLVSTTRQASRMFFPLNAFASVMNASEDREEMYTHFDTSGLGGFIMYTRMLAHDWSITNDMTSEFARQAVFHCIFGTFKEDLGILAQITNIGNWYTREQFGSSFKKTSKTSVTFKLPGLFMYSRLSAANMSGLLSGVYSQVCSLPVFSGETIHPYQKEFFNHIERKMNTNTSGKTITQLISSLTHTLDDLHNKVRQKEGRMEMGTVHINVM